MINDYDIYRFSPREYIRYSIEGFVIIIILGCLFYKSVSGILVLSPFIYVYLKRKKTELIKMRKWKLNVEFRDGINSLSASLNAGYSVEHAFEQAIKDLKRIYPKGAMIIDEFGCIINRIRMNEPAEKALYDFGRRSHVEDIISFSEVFATAKRTGGDLTQIIRTTAGIISSKLEIKREIATQIAAKKFEANIMKIVPAGILLYLSATSSGFLEPLYHNIFGVLIMSVLLTVYILSCRFIDKITTIEI